MRTYKEIPFDVNLDDITSIVVKTGYTYAQAAQELKIRYYNGCTYVETLGEFSNAAGMFCEGIVSPEECLADYRAEIDAELE